MTWPQEEDGNWVRPPVNWFRLENLPTNYPAAGLYFWLVTDVC